MFKLTFSRAAVAAPLMGAAVAVQAALPEGVETAISGSKADIATAGGLILGVVVAIAIIGWVRRVVH